MDDRQKEFAEARPSRVIEMALEDLEAVEKQTDKYTVDMSVWYVPDTFNYPSKCVVCLAGAVMAGTLKKSFKNELVPADFSPDICFRLLALDRFCRGLTANGLIDMGIEASKTEPIIAITPYDKDPARFKEDMRALAAKLKERGL